MSNPGIIQLFWRSVDRKVHSLWRNPDGGWNADQTIGGVLNGSPTAAQLPGTDVIQLFYRGSDNGVWSRWRDPAPETGLMSRALGASSTATPLPRKYRASIT